MELKPCPFCGSTNVSANGRVLGIRDVRYIVCMNCSCRTFPHDDMSVLVAAWNCRPPSDAVTSGGVKPT